MAEFDWIARYLKPLAVSAGADGLENDVARLGLNPEAVAIATMDTLIEGIHFLPGDPRHTLCRKLMRVNVSDILCKGGLPKQALLSIAIPDGFTEADFADLCDGLGEDLHYFNVDLLGGDLVRTRGPLALTLTLLGECCGREPLLRSTSRPGEAVLVTGKIGAGLKGFEDASAGVESDAATHYRVPDVPPLALSGILSQYATASIDVSDGLLSDAMHIAETSEVAIEIALEAVPWSEPVSSIERMLQLASGGDDYQTLFTLPGDSVEECLADCETAGVTVSRIGLVREGVGLRLQHEGEAVPVPGITGYQHS